MPGSSLYLTNYRLTFKDVAASDLTIDIEDRASGNGTAVYLPLTLQEASLQTINNDRNPFNPIVAKKLTLRFLSKVVGDNVYNADTFSVGTDNRFYVEVYTATTIAFQGFLLMDDIEEDLQNPAFGNSVTLTATDNIGTLKEQELIDTATGLALTDGHYTLLTYIQSCLARTGLSLNLNIAWNIFEESFIDTASPLTRMLLHSLTFEKELTTKEDCYTVLQKIISSLKARIYQYNGEWWLVRIHEYRRTADTVRYVKYDTTGTISGTFTDISCALPAGNGEAVYWINADASRTSQRPHKFDRDTYKYLYPREIIPNIDFTRGDFISGTNPKTFEWDRWTVGRRDGPVTLTPYIIRHYNSNNDEESRYAVIPATVSGNAHWMRSEGVPMSVLDKFNFSVDWKLNNNLTQGGNSVFRQTPIGMIRLEGEDGSSWVYGNYYNSTNGKPQIWYQTAGDLDDDFLKSYTIWAHWDPSGVNEEFDWQNVTFEIPPLPVGGDVFVYLVGFHHPDFGRQEVHFSNLNLDYTPHINGTYAKYNGQYHKVTQAEGFKANQDVEVHASDSPKKLFKGALKKFNYLTGKYVLTEDWTDTMDAGASGTVPLGKILTYDVWNQYRKPRTVITGTLRGVGNSMAYCGLFQRFTFTDYSTGKKFLCLHYDLNLKRTELRGEFIEVHDTADENDYLTDHEFKYVQ